jgi:hypothetical protein
MGGKCGTYRAKRCVCKVLVGKPEGGHMEDLRVDRIILKWVLNEQNGRAWTEFIGLRIGRSGGTL